MADGVGRSEGDASSAGSCGSHPSDEGEGSSDELLREVARLDDRDPPRPERPLGLGDRLGHFRVLSELGRGGMGIVYLAEDSKLRRQVALKVLPAAVARDEERRRRLLREARAAAAVNHAHIASVYEVGEANGRVYVAMERIAGEA